MATVSTKPATAISPSFNTVPQDISHAIMSVSSQAQKTRSTLIDGMPPAPPPSPVTFAKKGSYEHIPSLNLE
ncbi:hypothetical protein N7535_006474 [Penicillium sp. DV-2018c]|nr:hypothetical protein N7461_007442 [Penicillium sp. DV-2018c]KAJ5567168.1 hypothetical protein N7535_006474 [Penicillium sp. DV-2018c]